METIKTKLDKTVVSSDEKILHDWALGWNRKAIKVLGLWSYDSDMHNKNILSTVQTLFFIFGIISFVTIPQTLALFKTWGDLTLIVDNLIVNLPITISAIKLIILIDKKKVITRIFKSAQRDWEEDMTDHYLNVMISYAKISKLMTVVGFMGAWCALIFNHICPVFFGFVLRSVTNITDKSDEKLLALQSVYPFQLPATIFFYYLTASSQFLGCFLASIAYTGTDVFFGSLVLHCCAQFQILSHKIENTNVENFQKIFKIHVIRHCQLISFVKDIENSFNIILLILVVCFGLIFCIQAFQLISIFTDDKIHVPAIQLIYYINYMLYLFFLMLVYSWVGETLLSASQLIYNATFNCKWTAIRPKEAYQIMFLLIRTRLPLQITIGKFLTLNLNNFLKLVKTSAGYVSVLLAMRN